MTVLDAFAVIAFLRDEPAAAEVEALLRRGDATLTALGAAEIADHLVRVVGQSDEAALLDLAELGLPEVPVGSALARRAALLRARRYHRRTCSISLADCVVAEAARALDAPVATSDPHLLDVCRDEGIAVIPLPNSTGRRWPD